MAGIWAWSRNKRRQVDVFRKYVAQRVGRAVGGSVANRCEPFFLNRVFVLHGDLSIWMLLFQRPNDVPYSGKVIEAIMDIASDPIIIFAIATFAHLTYASTPPVELVVLSRGSSTSLEEEQGDIQYGDGGIHKVLALAALTLGCRFVRFTGSHTLHDDDELVLYCGPYY